jgi:CTP synthase (UTP-ammonia lyase)
VLVEYARNVIGVANAAHAEVDPTAESPVIEQLVCSLLGQHRMVRTVPCTRAAAICGDAPFVGYYMCGYGLAEGWRSILEAGGLMIGGYAEDAGVAMFELPEHPFFMGTLFHPQVGAPDAAPHPVLGAFADAVAGGAASAAASNGPR